MTTLTSEQAGSAALLVSEMPWPARVTDRLITALVEHVCDVTPDEEDVAKVKVLAGQRRAKVPPLLVLTHGVRDIPARQLEALTFLMVAGTASSTLLGEWMGVTRQAAWDTLRRMVATGILEEHGQTYRVPALVVTKGG